MIKKRAGNHMSEDEIMMKFVQICLGLMHVHNKVCCRKVLCQHMHIEQKIALGGSHRLQYPWDSGIPYWRLLTPQDDKEFCQSP